MNPVIKLAAAILVLALAAGGAVAQGCGCGGDGEKPEVTVERVVAGEIEIVVEKDGCGGDCGSKGECSGQCGGKTDRKCSGDCSDGGKCGGDCGGKDGRKCSGSCGEKGDCGGTCSEVSFVRMDAAGSLTEAVKQLEKRSKELRKQLRVLADEGREEEAKALAVALKDLNKQIARLRELAKDEPQGGAAGGALVFRGTKDGRVVATRAQPKAARSGFLGVTMGESEDGSVRIVATVDGSPAARSGIRAGDHIVAIGERKVQNPEELAAAVQAIEPGRIVRIQAVRGDRKVFFAVKLGERPAATAAKATPAAPPGPQQLRAVRRAPGVGVAKAQPRRVVMTDFGGLRAQIAKREQAIALASKKLIELRAKAQRALAASQYELAADLTRAAFETSRELEAAKKSLAVQKQQAARMAAAAAAESRAAATQARGRAAQAAAPTSQVQRLERRLAAMEGRLARIEKMLERLAASK